MCLIDGFMHEQIIVKDDYLGNKKEIITLKVEVNVEDDVFIIVVYKNL